MIPAVLAVIRADLRRRWPTVVALTLLAALIGAVVLGTVVGMRRTATAYDRLVATSGFADAVVRVVEPEPGLERQLRGRRDVEGLSSSTFAVSRLVRPGPLQMVPVQFDLASISDLPVVEGRMAADVSTDEIVMAEKIASTLELEVGDAIAFEALTRDDFAALLRDRFDGTVNGPSFDVRLVGTVRSPTDAVFTEFSLVVGSDALRRQLGDELPDSATVFVDLAPGADAGAFAREVRAAGPTAPSGRLNRVDVLLLGDARSAVDDAVRILVTGMAVFAVVVAVAGTLVVGQMIARHASGARLDPSTLRAVGFNRSGTGWAVVLPGVIVATAAAALAPVVASLASVLTPIGVAREVEPDPGLDLNTAWLVVGSLVVLCWLAVTWWIATRRVRRSRSRGSVPSVRSYAFLRSSSRPSLSVGAALMSGRRVDRTESVVSLGVTGLVVGLAGLLAAATFGASLDRLVATPDRWGFVADHAVEVPETVRTDTYARLSASPDVEAFAEVVGADGHAADRAVPVYSFRAVKGSMSPTLLSGRLPAGPAEVAVGPGLLAGLDRDVGDEIEFVLAGERRTARVVGEALSFGLDDRDASDNSLLVTPEAIDDPLFHTALVRHRDGVDGDAVAARLYPDGEYGSVHPPSAVANVAALRRLPSLLAAFFACLSLASVGHALVVTVVRRRRDLAVLGALGMTPRQLVRVGRIMALVTVGTGVLVGLPAGLLLGDAVWVRTAEGLSVATDVRWPAVVAATGPFVLVSGALVGTSAVRRARREPALVLRSE